jgi:hypothetical protein
MSLRPGKLKGGKPSRETPVPTLDDLKAEVAEPIVRLNANMPKSLLKRLKQRALDEDTTMTELVIKAVNEYLSRSV